MNIGIEDVADCVDELNNIFLSHHEEIEPDKDKYPTLDFDWESLLAVNSVGSILFVSVRDDEEVLVGYCISYVVPNLFYKKDTSCLTNLFYISEKYRKGLISVKVLKFLEKELINKGVRYWTIAHLTHYNVASLYKRAGFVPSESMYKKHLG